MSNRTEASCQLLWAGCFGLPGMAAAAANARLPTPETTSADQAGQPEHDMHGVLSTATAGQSEPEVQFASTTTTTEHAMPGPRVRGTVTARSSWRWPSEPGKLPHYVRAQFHFKSFGLIAGQCLVAFCIAALVEVGLRTHMPDVHKGGFTFALFVAMGCFTMLLLLMLLCVQRIYPLNYLALTAVTLLVGATWGMGGTSLATHAHFQLFGILCVATSFAAAFSSVSHRLGLGGKLSVAVPLLAGWLLGSVIEAIVAWRLGAHPIWSGMAVLIALGQILWLLLDVGDKLQECNPDDFMRIVISMDSTLLVVVSIPLFVVAACFLHSNRQIDQEDNNAAANGAANGVAAVV